MKARMDDLIVILPGITGSVLQKDGKDLWSPSFSAIFRAVTSLGQNLKQMALRGDDPERDDLGDGIRAVRLIPDAVVVPGFFKIDGYSYTRLSKMIKSRFRVTEGSIDLSVNPYPPANFFEFPYDWRRDNRVAARLLGKVIETRLAQWRAHVGGDAKVILLAHSMGGIVARYYLEVMGGFQDCKALFTFGTPYRGALKALNYLANGWRKSFVDLTTTIRSFTSVYQLLPIYKAVNTEGGYQKAATLEIDGVDPNKALEALAFHNRIMDHVDSRVKDNQNSYILWPVVGSQQPTFQSAELVGGKLTATDALPAHVDPLLGHGDGTVPALSAIPHELSDLHRNYFCAETHSSLQCNEQVLNFVCQQLVDMQVRGLGKIRGSPSAVRHPPAGLSLCLDDAYTEGEPIDIRVRLLRDGGDLDDEDWLRKHVSSLEAVVEPVDRSVPSVTLAMNRRETDWGLTCEDLSPGLYRIAVGPTRSGPLSPKHVHDLFQVAEELEREG